MTKNWKLRNSKRLRHSFKSIDVQTRDQPAISVNPLFHHHIGSSLESSVYDLWSTPANNISSTVKTDNHINEWTKETLISKKKVRTQRSLVSDPVRVGTFKSAVCHPGSSYNPAPKEHVEAMEIAANFCLKENEPERTLEKIMTRANAAEFHTVEELEEDNEDFNVPANPIVRAEDRLTRAQKNRRARHKLLITQHRRTKKNRQLLHQISLAKQMTQDIKKKQDIQATRPLKKQRRLLISGRSMPTSFPDVLIRDEIGGGLRQMVVRPGLIRDRFVHLQRKGLVEH